jgi:hypothetical protein
MAESSQGVRLRVYITDENTPSTVGTFSLKPPNPKPVRVEVPHLESEFIDKLNIPVVDQGDVTGEFYFEQANAVHAQLRTDMVTRPAPVRKWDIVKVVKDELGAESITPLDTFNATLMDFPRTFQERQAIKGSLTLSLDNIPVLGEPS